MLGSLQSANKAVGAKQVGRALKSGRAQQVFVAQDADPKVTEPVLELCEANAVPVEQVNSMLALGKACGISVGSALAAILR